MKEDVELEYINVFYKKNRVWEKGVGGIRVKNNVYTDDWDVTGRSKVLENVMTPDHSERIDVEPVDALMFRIGDAVEVTIGDRVQRFFNTVIIRFDGVYEFGIVDPLYYQYFINEFWFYGGLGTIIINQFPVDILRVPPSISYLWCHEHTNIIGLEHHLSKNTEVQISS